ncbi:hypothetical protein VPH35_012042 [Triticum aestivum]
MIEKQNTAKQRMDGWMDGGLSLLLPFFITTRQKQDSWMDGWRPLFSSRQEGRSRIDGWMYQEDPATSSLDLQFSEQKSLDLQVFWCGVLLTMPVRIRQGLLLLVAMPRRTQFPLSFFLSFQEEEEGNWP